MIYFLVDDRFAEHTYVDDFESDDEDVSMFVFLLFNPFIYDL